MSDLAFPESLPEFQRLFPDDAACATYMERLRWAKVFACAKCGVEGEPYRFANRPGVLRCRSCKADTALTKGTVMQRTHTPLSTWFWGAYLVSSLTPGMSAVQFQRQLGLTRYETAFQTLHKLRSGMVRPDREKIGGKYPVELDETYVGGRTRGEGKGVHHKALVIGAVEVRKRQTPGPLFTQNKAVPRRGGRYAGRVRLSVAPDRKAQTLVGFARRHIERRSDVTTDDWGGYDNLSVGAGLKHLQIPVLVDGQEVGVGGQRTCTELALECTRDPEVATKEHPPWITTHVCVDCPKCAAARSVLLLSVLNAPAVRASVLRTDPVRKLQGRSSFVVGKQNNSRKDLADLKRRLEAGEFNKMLCLFPKCRHNVRARGLCRDHYASACRLVRLKKQTWAALEKAGKCLAPVRPAADFFR